MSALFSSTSAWADKPTPLEPEFLDYLLKYEGKDDNWTVAADDQARERVRALRKQRAQEQQRQQEKEQ